MPAGTCQAFLGIQGGNGDGGAQGRFHKGEVRLVMEIPFLPGEEGMGGDLDFQVEVAGQGRPWSPASPSPRRRRRVPVSTPGGMRTWICFFSFTVPPPPQLTQGEVMRVPAPRQSGQLLKIFRKSPGLADLAPAPAAGAGLTLGAGLQAAAAATPATDSSFHLQAGIQASGHFFQGQDHPLAQIGAGLGPFGPGRPFPEAEEFFEHVPKGAKDILKTAEAADIHAGQARLAVQVVKLPLLGIRQHLVSFGNELELLFRRCVPGILVGMILEGQLPVGAFDLLQGGLPGDP